MDVDIRTSASPESEPSVFRFPDVKSVYFEAGDGHDDFVDDAGDNSFQDFGDDGVGEEGTFDGGALSVGGEAGGLVGRLNEFLRGDDQAFNGFHFGGERGFFCCGGRGGGLAGRGCAESWVNDAGDADEGWESFGGDGGAGLRDGCHASKGAGEVAEEEPRPGGEEEESY